MNYSELTEKEKNVYNLIMNKSFVEYGLNKNEFLRVLSVIIEFVSFGSFK